MKANIHKLHIHYSRALTQVLVKYVERDKLSAVRNEIAQVILDEIVGEDWIPPENLEGDWEDHLDDMALNYFRSLQRGVVIGKEAE